MAAQPVPDVYDKLLAFLKGKNLTKITIDVFSTEMKNYADLSGNKENIFSELKNLTEAKPTLVFDDTSPLTADKKEVLNPMKILMIIIEFLKENRKNRDSMTKEFLKNFFLFQPSASYPTDDEHTKFKVILEEFLTKANELLAQQKGGGLNPERKKSITRKRKQPRPLPS